MSSPFDKLFEVTRLKSRWFPLGSTGLRHSENVDSIEDRTLVDVLVRRAEGQ